MLFCTNKKRSSDLIASQQASVLHTEACNVFSQQSSLVKSAFPETLTWNFLLDSVELTSELPTRYCEFFRLSSTSSNMYHVTLYHCSICIQQRYPSTQDFSGKRKIIAWPLLRKTIVETRHFLSSVDIAIRCRPGPRIFYWCNKTIQLVLDPTTKWGGKRKEELLYSTLKENKMFCDIFPK